MKQYILQLQQSLKRNEAKSLTKSLHDFKSQQATYYRQKFDAALRGLRAELTSQPASIIITKALQAVQSLESAPVEQRQDRLEELAQLIAEFPVQSKDQPKPILQKQVS